jgi:predicted SnoaL-like aldol condensation-catalyzing enzyme
LLSSLLFATVLGLIPAILRAEAATTTVSPNVQLVLDFYRQVLVARDAGAAAKYLRPDYIQHNPNVAQGLAGLQEMVRRMAADPRAPRPSETDVTPAKIVAEGDLVVLVFEHRAPDPDDPGKTYAFNTLDMFRIEDGKIAEHWDGAMKRPRPAP